MSLRGITNTDYLLSRILAAVDKWRRLESGQLAKRFRYPADSDPYPRSFDARIVAAAAAVGKLVEANPRRVALLVRAESAATIRIWPKSDVSTTVGIIPNQTDFTEFVRDKHGDLVTSEWYCISGVGAQTVTVIEVF